jgi:hypothetical protein
MADLALEIRKIIFEKYNDSDTKFTNDEIFDAMQRSGTVDKSKTIDDMEQYFTTLCDSGIMRNIAQNFTTQWFKLFDTLDKAKCPSCQAEIYISKSEEKNCPACKAAI